MKIFTIGHSNHTIEKFISLLQKHRITAVADVRSHPYSRYLPHFNKSLLPDALSKVGISYVFLGRELGARPEDLSCYDLQGKALYERIAATAFFSAGIQRLIQGAEKYQIALMCAEKDPITCHRTILVCKNLRKFDISINHILPEGKLENHSQLEERLLAKFNKSNHQPIQLNLFEAPKALESKIDLDTAYQRQGNEIAYVKKVEKNTNLDNE